MNLNIHSKLFQPIQIGNVRIRNRIVLSPMGTRTNLLDGTISDRCSMYLEERARGGAGLIIPEQTSVRIGYMRVPAMSIHSDLLLPALGSMVDAVHSYDSKIIMQLGLHGGRAASKITGHRCIAPSAISSPLYTEIPEALEVDEIYQLVDEWKIAALRAQSIGFDGVEIHGCHGYLINQFLSPHTNVREDEFGGNLENRLRFASLIHTAVREACGPDFIIGFKMPGLENMPNGLIIEDSVQIAKMIENQGEVDYLHVSVTSATLGYTQFPDVPSMYDGVACLSSLSETIKKTVNLPVIAVGGIVSPEDAEKVLEEGRADMVAIGRPFLADSGWGEKPLNGDPIKPCIGCMNCHKHVLNRTDIECTVNPRLLRESFDEQMLKRDSMRHKVLVIGAGPSGIEAALQAAEGGHSVTVIEAKDRIGGTLRIAAKPDFKKRVYALLDYYERMIASKNISLLFNTLVNQDNLNSLIENTGADTVIFSVGGIPIHPDFACKDVIPIFIAEDVIEQDLDMSRFHNIGILGAGKVGLETAWLLADQNREVSVFDILDKKHILGNDHPVMKTSLLHQMDKHNIKIIAGTRIQKLIASGIEAEMNGEQVKFEVDAIILALGYRPNTLLYEYCLAHGNAKRVMIVGDAKLSRGLYSAIHEGFFAGRYRV